MPLHTAPAPANGAALVQEHLQHLAQRPTPNGTLAALAIDRQQAHPPHAVYDLRADDIAAGRGLASAHFSGFRYLVGPVDSPTAAAEVIAASTTAPAQMVAAVHYGPFVASSAQAIRQLSTLPQTQSTDYEVRFLRFSAIPVVAIWLKSDSAAPDILYPLGPTPTGLEAGKTYTPDQFLAPLIPIAQIRAQKTEPTTP